MEHWYASNNEMVALDCLKLVESLWHSVGHEAVSLVNQFDEAKLTFNMFDLAILSTTSLPLSQTYFDI